LNAINHDDTEELKKVFDSAPEVDVNRMYANVNNWSPLHHATFHEKMNCLKFLLARPDIDVNLKVSGGQTPLHTAMTQKKLESMKLLLKDPRIDKWAKDDFGMTPLQIAGDASVLFLKGMEWWIVLDEEFSKPTLDDEVLYALKPAKTQRKLTNLRHLAYIAGRDPRFTQFDLKLRHNVGTARSFFLFAVVVLSCDGFLETKKEKTDNTTRFFNIARRVPMEIQMILCHRAYGSTKEIVKTDDLDFGLRKWVELERML
jgi:hypothetical protein